MKILRNSSVIRPTTHLTPPGVSRRSSFPKLGISHSESRGCAVHAGQKHEHHFSHSSGVSRGGLLSGYDLGSVGTNAQAFTSNAKSIPAVCTADKVVERQSKANLEKVSPSKAGYWNCYSHNGIRAILGDFTPTGRRSKLRNDSKNQLQS